MELRRLCDEAIWLLSENDLDTARKWFADLRDLHGALTIDALNESGSLSIQREKAFFFFV